MPLAPPPADAEDPAVVRRQGPGRSPYAAEVPAEAPELDGFESEEDDEDDEDDEEEDESDDDELDDFDDAGELLDEEPRLSLR